MKKLCCNCKHRGNLFRLGIGSKVIPHCHCHHPSIPEEDFGWGTLREAFQKCDKFEEKTKGGK